MTERPILFSAPMIRALLASMKTQTRRALRGFCPPSTPEFDSETGRLEWFNGDEVVAGMRCPYGKPGERLWVREAWRADSDHDDKPPRDIGEGSHFWYEADRGLSAIRGLSRMGKLRPGMFMPRWASRITLEVTEVRVERLQDISRGDAIAEGIEADAQPSDTVQLWRNYSTGGTTVDPRFAYETLWDQINGPGAWDANPWVWAVSFKRVEA